MVKKLWRYVKPFSSDTGTLRTDGRTDRRTDRRTDLLYQYRASVCWRAIKIKHNHENFTKRWDFDFKKSLFVKAVWCTKAVEWISRLGLET